MNRITKLATASFAAALVALSSGCMTEDDDGTGIETATQLGEEQAVTTTAAFTPSSLSIPAAHPRLWFNAARLDRAKTYFRSHPFTAPSSVDDADDAINAALHTTLTGDATGCTKAIAWANPDTGSRGTI